MNTIREWAIEVHSNAVEKGFWEDASDDPKYAASKLALIHSEVSEALEALRMDDHANFAEELADVVIRTLDLAEGCNIDLELVMRAKHRVNLSRERKHGKRF